MKQAFMEAAGLMEVRICGKVHKAFMMKVHTIYIVRSPTAMISDATEMLKPVCLVFPFSAVPCPTVMALRNLSLISTTRFHVIVDSSTSNLTNLRKSKLEVSVYLVGCPFTCTNCSTCVRVICNRNDRGRDHVDAFAPLAIIRQHLSVAAKCGWYVDVKFLSDFASIAQWGQIPNILDMTTWLILAWVAILQLR